MGGDELLRALGGISAAGVGSVERGATRVAGAANASNADFGEMLRRAREGTFESGLPVTVATGADVELSNAQLSRLGPVIDRLHTSGASHAMVEIDGRFMVVDVITRQVRSEFKPGETESVQGIDAVVSAPPASDASIGPPGIGVISPSLAAALIADKSEVA